MTVVITSLDDGDELACNIIYLHKYLSLAAAYGWTPPQTDHGRPEAAITRLSRNEALSLAQALERAVQDVDHSTLDSLTAQQLEFIKSLAEFFRKGECIVQ